MTANTPSSREDIVGTASWKRQVFCYLLLATLMVYVLAARYFKPLLPGGPAGIEPAGIPQVEQRIDPNKADWSEFARLPDIGEVLAKRIVAYRSEQRAVLGLGFEKAGDVFFSPADLDPIKGIGHKTLAGLEPYLKFPVPQTIPAR